MELKGRTLFTLKLKQMVVLFQLVKQLCGNQKVFVILLTVVTGVIVIIGSQSRSQLVKSYEFKPYNNKLQERLYTFVKLEDHSTDRLH